MAAADAVVFHQPQSGLTNQQTSPVHAHDRNGSYWHSSNCHAAPSAHDGPRQPPLNQNHLVAERYGYAYSPSDGTADSLASFGPPMQPDWSSFPKFHCHLTRFLEIRSSPVVRSANTNSYQGNTGPPPVHSVQQPQLTQHPLAPEKV